MIAFVRDWKILSQGDILDLFDKCSNFTLADEIKQQGFYPYFRPIQANEGPVVQMEGRQVIMAGSNNYLGLTAHPKVKEAAKRLLPSMEPVAPAPAILQARLTSTSSWKGVLQNLLGARIACCSVPGFQTAQGIIPTLVQRGEYVVSDKDNHACIVAGNMIAMGMTSEVVRYRHNDMKHLGVVLSKLPLDTGKLIVSDGVFSTSGEIVDLPALVQGCKAIQRAHSDRRRSCNGRDRERRPRHSKSFQP